MLLGNATGVKNGMAFLGEGVGVECHEGVFGVVFLEAVVQSEEAWEVFYVGDEGRPDCYNVSVLQLCIVMPYNYPFVTLSPVESEPSRLRYFRVGLVG